MLTIDDYLKLPEGVRVELIDGVFYDMAAPTTVHQMIAQSISSILLNYIKDNKGINCDKRFKIIFLYTVYT